jgi:hypothetical protein
MMVMTAKTAVQIGIGKADIVKIDIGLIALVFPVHTGIELVKIQQLRKTAG